MYVQWYRVRAFSRLSQGNGTSLLCDFLETVRVFVGNPSTGSDDITLQGGNSIMRLQRWLVVAMAAVVMLGAGAPTIAAQESQTVWAEFSSIYAPQGCVIDVSIDGGPGLAGASVSLVTSDDDTGAVVSSDSGSANERGIAWLAIDTSASTPEAKLWASISINGSYVSGRTVRVAPDGACAGTPTLLTMTGQIASPNGAPIEPAGTNAMVLPAVFRYQQERGLSCEYSSLAIVSDMLGNWTSEYEFEAEVPLNVNPHWGYRGDITGSWGNTDDYGVYAAPLVPALNAYGFGAEAWYGDSYDLVAQLDLGRPTLVWVGIRGDEGAFNEYTADGTRFKLLPFMHVVVIYGYDDGGVYVSDPGNGKLKYWDWNTFEWMWDAMDGMALSIWR
jgi:uncharacterized protein YvpB